MRAARRIILLIAGAGAVVACSKALGLADYKDAAHELCSVCTTLDGCETTLEDKLGAATEEQRSAWLKRYSELHCDKAQCDTTALECFYSAPGNCADTGVACSRSEACCGFDFDAPEKGAACCVDSGGGACCAGCRSCAAVLGDATPDVSTLCLSELPLWSAVKECHDKNCTPEHCSCSLENKCGAVCGALCSPEKCETNCMNIFCKSEVAACLATAQP